MPTTAESIQPPPHTAAPKRNVSIEEVAEVPETLTGNAELAQQKSQQVNDSPDFKLHSPLGNAQAPLNVREAPAPSSEPLFEVDEVHLIATSPLSELKWEPDFEPPIGSPAPVFSQPSAAALVSPPASHSDAERTPPAPSKAQNNITPYATSSSSRHSSHTAKNGQRYTPESGPARRASSSSAIVERPKLRDSGSPAANAAARGTPLVEGSGQKKKSRMSSEFEGDEESMRLIEELRAQDLGLRRRGRV